MENLLTTEVADKFQNIIASEVWHYIRKLGRDDLKVHVEDLIQEIWIKLLEVIKESNKLPTVSYIRQLCHGTLVDWTRKGTRDYHLSYDYDPEGNRSEWEEDPFSKNFVKDAEVKDLLNMFPKGSKERTYIEFYLSKAGVDIEGAKTIDVEDKFRSNYGGYTDSALAKLLGFKGTADRGWKRFRDQMKGIISDYYGIS